MIIRYRLVAQGLKEIDIELMSDRSNGALQIILKLCCEGAKKFQDNVMEDLVCVDQYNTNKLYCSSCSFFTSHSSHVLLSKCRLSW